MSVMYRTKETVLKYLTTLHALCDTLLKVSQSGCLQVYKFRELYWLVSHGVMEDYGFPRTAGALYIYYQSCAHVNPSIMIE